MFCLLSNVHSTWHKVGDSRFWIVYDMCSVSVSNSFLHCQTASDCGYHTFGELARFIYCLLQKITQGSSLLLVEQWDDYVLRNHSKFPPIADGEFLAGTRVLAALNKIGGPYLKREFQRDARRFLGGFLDLCADDCGGPFEDWTGVALFLSSNHHRGRRPCATASAGSSARWPFGSWMDQGQWYRGLPGWIPVLRSGATTAGAVFDEEPPWHRWCPVVLLFGGWFSCSSASVESLYRDQYGKVAWLVSWKILILFFQFFQLTALIVRGPVTCGGRFIIKLDRVMICADEVQSAILCVQDFVRSPHFTQRNFFSDSGIAMLAESAAISDRITHSAVFEPSSHVETTSHSQVVADVCGCVNEALDRRRVVKDSQEQWYAVGGFRPSSEDSTFRSGVRILNVVEKGRVKYVPVRVSFPILPGPSNLRDSSGRSKKRTNN